MSLGFAEEEPEYDPNEEKSSVVSDKDEDEPPVDCSWFRCPLYRDDMVARTRKMLKCSRCKAVRYHVPENPHPEADRSEPGTILWR